MSNDPFMQDPIMQEAFKAKYDLAAENGMDIQRVAAAIRAFNDANPHPPVPKSRKLIQDHPLGRSVLRDDEILAELRNVKEQLSVKIGKPGTLRKELAKIAKRIRDRPPLRSAKSSLRTKHRGNGRH